MATAKQIAARKKFTAAYGGKKSSAKKSTGKGRSSYRRKSK